jgi:acetyl esterase/lipase
MAALYLSDTECIYKTVGKKELKLSFLPPTVKMYNYAPLYFLIPGGGWHSADRQSMINFSNISVEILRKNGFAVASIEYRTVGEETFVFDTLEDCFDALGYMFEHSEEFGIDVKRIVTSGHSAGGHLALMLAYADGNIFSNRYDFKGKGIKPSAVAALSPATVFHTEGYPKTIGFGIDYLFSDPSCLDDRKKAGPMEYVNSLTPPTILFAGGADPIVFANSSEILYEKLKKANVKAKLVLSHNAGHCFEKLMPDSEPSVSFEETQKILADFVLENL